MICPKKVQRTCLFGADCLPDMEVDDGGDCAEYIRKTLAAMDGVQPDQADPVEAAEVQQEREAIREEIAEHCSTTKCQSYKREVQK